jgi:hypothetical protein
LRPNTGRIFIRLGGADNHGGAFKLRHVLIETFCLLVRSF